MSTHKASVRWARDSADFTYDTYSRAFAYVFKDGAMELAGSAAPAFRGDGARVDPEEAYVASLSACHMLTFLAIAARKRLVVDSYEDDADGPLEKGADGRFWMPRVTLRPCVRFGGNTEVDSSTLARMHHQAHEQCFIANSVKTEILVEPRA
ncbi:MAG TPA: OsmC family protein [Rhizomicrobium sp.]|nr:OsmC family protein [Rhizomicrobium sp.]